MRATVGSTDGLPPRAAGTVVRVRPLTTGLGALLVLLGSAAVTDDVAADRASAAWAAAPSASARLAAGGHHIDNGDKDEVRRAWRNRFRDNLDTPSGWIGNTALCVPGFPSEEAQDATRESVNFVRAMAGLDRVTFGDGLSSRAQQAALMMDANNQLSHDPPQSWDCWTEQGDDAAGHSNLAITTGTMDAGEAIELYMDDLGPSNRVASHRRWILRPEATRFGNGLTDTASALWVIGPSSERRANPRWVSWPSPGWFPAGLEPHGRWSLSSRSDRADFSDARVSVRRVHGRRLEVSTYKSVNGYGKPTLVFRVQGLERTGKYRVTVRDIKQAAAGRHSWVVKLFD